MTNLLRKRLRRFCKNEDGNSTIEFMFWFPFFLYVGYSGMDLGLQSFHHADLERSLDITVREVRLNRLPAGETEWDHDLLKEMICDEAMITNCLEHLALEMTPIDPRVGNPLDNPGYLKPKCVDTPALVRPPESVLFETGTSNELMIIRACLEVSPVWGFTMIGGLAEKDPDGQWELHATTVFVHEPFGGSTSPADAGSTETTVDVADASP